MIDTLKKLALAAALALCLAPQGAKAAQSWNFGHLMPADSSEGLVHARFAELVEDYTDGEVKISLFPASQLGARPAQLEQLQAGTLQIFTEANGSLNSYIDELKWTSAPFMFDDLAHWKRFMNSDVIKGYENELREKHGITFIGDNTVMARGPYRVLVANKELDGLDDVQDLKLRMFESKFHIDIWKHLGAEVVVLGWADVYAGLSSGLIQGVTSPISLVQTMKFTEVAPNVLRTNEFPQALMYMVNAEAWEGLDDATRAAIERAHAEAAVYAQQLVDSSIEKTLAELEAANIRYSDADVRAFTARMQPYYAEKVAEGELPKEIFDAVNATRE